jgi:hypothetical protein
VGTKLAGHLCESRRRDAAAGHSGAATARCQPHALSRSGNFPYTGPDKLTIGGEANKLAANIALGRNHAGVHWRSDYQNSLYLGEEIAIHVLQDQKATNNENANWTFTRFNGSKITI